MQEPKSIPLSICSSCLTEALATQLLGTLKIANLLCEALQEESASEATLDHIALVCDRLEEANAILAAEAGLDTDSGTENDELLN